MYGVLQGSAIIVCSQVPKIDSSKMRAQALALIGLLCNQLWLAVNPKRGELLPTEYLGTLVFLHLLISCSPSCSLNLSNPGKGHSAAKQLSLIQAVVPSTLSTIYRTRLRPQLPRPYVNTDILNVHINGILREIIEASHSLICCTLDHTCGKLLSYRHEEASTSLLAPEKHY